MYNNLGTSALKEQLSINDWLKREVLHKKYRFLNDPGTDPGDKGCVLKPGQQGIVPKIDWFSIMLSEVSIQEIFDWLDIPDVIDLDDAILKNFYQMSVGYDERLFFSWNGITISFSLFDVRDIPLDLNFFQLVCPRVKLDLSGTGLDYLRLHGRNIDDFLRDIRNYEFFDNSYSITRCDFAFDLINWQSDFLNRCFEYVRSNHTSANRLCCVGLTAALAYSERHGSDETLYIGSPTSDKLLRIYDKRLQFIDRETGAYIKPNFYSNPDSWIRVEWQLRNKKAVDILFGDGDFFSIYKKIYESYPFADLSTPSHRRLKHPFWEDLFKADDDFNTIKSLVLNKVFHFVQLVVPRDHAIGDRLPYDLIRYIEFIFFCETRGIKVGDDLKNLINSMWIQLQTPTDDPGLDLKRRKRLQAIGNRLSQHSNYYDMKNFVFVISDGCVRFRLSTD